MKIPMMKKIKLEIKEKELTQKDSKLKNKREMETITTKKQMTLKLKKKEKTMKRKKEPKKKLIAYNYYRRERYPILKQKFESTVPKDDLSKQVISQISSEWKNMSKKQKQKYVDMELENQGEDSPKKRDKKERSDPVEKRKFTPHEDNLIMNTFIASKVSLRQISSVDWTDCASQLNRTTTTVSKRFTSFMKDPEKKRQIAIISLDNEKTSIPPIDVIRGKYKIVDLLSTRKSDFPLNSELEIARILVQSPFEMVNSYKKSINKEERKMREAYQILNNLEFITKENTITNKYNLFIEPKFTTVELDYLIKSIHNLSGNTDLPFPKFSQNIFVPAVMQFAINENIELKDLSNEIVMKPIAKTNSTNNNPGVENVNPTVDPIISLSTLLSDKNSSDDNRNVDPTALTKLSELIYSKGECGITLFDLKKKPVTLNRFSFQMNNHF